MRIHRVRLRDVRGVAEREVAFAETGVTVVVGPNEAGKSTLAEAIDLALEELDSAKSRRVKEVQPVHRDAGPEIELEISAGPYRFVLLKRFLKHAETRLVVTEPRPENRTGREAHERVAQILGETVDLALWKALRLVQGNVVEQAGLTTTGSLAEALDRAAGTVAAGGREESLFDRARGEYEQFFTPKDGRPRAEAQALEGRVKAGREESARLGDRLAELEGDVERVARAERELARLGVEEAAAAERLAALEATDRRLADAVARRSELETKDRLARSELERAERAVQERAEAASRLDGRAAEADAAGSARQELDAELEGARHRRTDAAAAAERARSALAAARADERRLRDLGDRASAEVELRRLERWKAEVDLASIANATATAELATIRVDDGVLEEIRRAVEAVDVGRARAERALPTLRLRAEGALEVELDGERTTIAAGDGLDRSIADRLVLRVPGRFELEVAAGTGDRAGAATEPARAEAALRELLETAGVADPAAAAEANRRWRALREEQRVAREKEAAILQGAGVVRRAELDERLEALRGRVAAAASAAAAGAAEAGTGTKGGARAAAPATDPAAALAALAPQLVALERAFVDADALERAEATRAEALEQRAAAATERAAVLGREADLARDALEAARAVQQDDALAEERERRAAELAAIAPALEAARAALAGEDPESLAVRLENARSVLGGVREQAAALERERSAAQARLEVLGRDGLAEARDRVLTTLTADEAELARWRRRAAARRVLFETLREERERANRAYVEPLRERIEQLARVVFGAEVRIELDDQLRIVSRTVDDRTIPFGSLSVGTREQLVLIARLACAMTVAGDGGVPVVIDDALGYADPDRLASMGAVLAFAGRTCQVLVLTCHPDRYRQVGGATTIRVG